MNPGVASGPHIDGAMLVDGSSKPKWLRASSCTAVCSSKECPNLRTHVDPIHLGVDFSYLSQAWSAVWAETGMAKSMAKIKRWKEIRRLPGLKDETWGTRLLWEGTRRAGAGPIMVVNYLTVKTSVVVCVVAVTPLLDWAVTLIV